MTKLDGAARIAMGIRDPSIETGKIIFQSLARAHNIIKKKQLKPKATVSQMS